jgi:hypothetical protein
MVSESISAPAAPWVAFAETIIDALAEAERFVNVYPLPTEGIAIPAIVIRPDEPWMEGVTEDEPFATRRERYAVVLVTSSATASDGTVALRDMAKLVMGCEGAGWRWMETTAPVVTAANGVDYLACTMHWLLSAED